MTFSVQAVESAMCNKGCIFILLHNSRNIREGIHSDGLVCLSCHNKIPQTGGCVSTFPWFSVVSDSVWPHRLQPSRLLCPWDAPGKNTGVGCHFLLQGILPDPGLELMPPALQADSLPVSHLGSPKYLLQLLEIRTYSPTFVLYTNLYKHFPLFFIKSPTWKN